MNGRSMLIVATMALVLAILSGVAISAQDRYTLRLLPDGLAFSDFKGYGDWQLISTDAQVPGASDAGVTHSGQGAES